MMSITRPFSCRLLTNCRSTANVAHLSPPTCRGLILQTTHQSSHQQQQQLLTCRNNTRRIHTTSTHHTTPITYVNYHTNIPAVHPQPPRSSPTKSARVNPRVTTTSATCLLLTHSYSRSLVTSTTNQLQSNGCATSSAIGQTNSNDQQQSTSGASDESSSHELLSASMSAFAKMEAQIRAKKKAEEQAASGATTSSPTASPSSSSSTSWTMKFPVQKPSEPTEGMCCNRGCQNCVWIQYSEQLAEWEEEQRAMGLDPNPVTYDVTYRSTQPTIDSSSDVSADSAVVSPSTANDHASPSSSAPSTPSPLGLPVMSSPARTLSRFERAMAAERAIIAGVIPHGKGQKRALTAMLEPHQNEEQKKDK